MIYFLQLQRLGLATIYPVVGSKGYVVVAEVRDNQELLELLQNNPMWPVEDYQVLAAKRLWSTVRDRGSAVLAPPPAQRFVVFARPSFPIPRRANQAKTRDLLRDFAARDPEGLLLEIVEDAGYGFVAIGVAVSHDELMRELFAVPLGNWGEFEVHALGTMEGEHLAVEAAGMVPAGSLLAGKPTNEPHTAPARAPTSPPATVQESGAGWGLVQQVTADELWARLAAEHGSATLVDVRSPAEFQAGSIKGSLLVPLDELTDLLDRWGADAPPNLVFVCERGSRSLLAARAAARRGVACASLRGGVRAWQESGRPLQVAQPAGLAGQHEKGSDEA